MSTWKLDYQRKTTSYDDHKKIPHTSSISEALNNTEASQQFNRPQEHNTETITRFTLTTCLRTKKEETGEGGVRRPTGVRWFLPRTLVVEEEGPAAVPEAALPVLPCDCTLLTLLVLDVRDTDLLCTNKLLWGHSTTPTCCAQTYHSGVTSRHRPVVHKQITLGSLHNTDLLCTNISLWGHSTTPTCCAQTYYSGVTPWRPRHQPVVQQQITLGSLHDTNLLCTNILLWGHTLKSATLTCCAQQITLG